MAFLAAPPAAEASHLNCNKPPDIVVDFPDSASVCQTSNDRSVNGFDPCPNDFNTSDNLCTADPVAWAAFTQAQRLQQGVACCFDPTFGRPLGDASGGSTLDVFSRLRPGAITNNPFGQLVDFDNCLGELDPSSGVCDTAKPNVILPDPGTRSFNAFQQAMITPLVSDAGLPIGNTAKRFLLDSQEEVFDTSNTTSSQRTLVRDLFKAAEPAVEGTAGFPGLFGSITSASAGALQNDHSTEFFMELFAINPETATNLTTPFGLKCLAADTSTGGTLFRACSTQAVYEEVPGVGSAQVGETASEIFLNASTFMTPHTGSSTGVIADLGPELGASSGAFPQVHWRIMVKQSTFFAELKGQFQRCQGKSDPGEACEAYAFPQATYPAGITQTEALDPVLIADPTQVTVDGELISLWEFRVIKCAENPERDGCPAQ